MTGSGSGLHLPLGLPDAERAELLWERAGCRDRAGDFSGWRADPEECVGLGGEPYAHRAAQRLTEFARS